MDEPVMEEPPPEEVDGATQAAKWARPRLEAFDAKEKAITFQVSFGRFQAGAIIPAKQSMRLMS